MLLKTSALLSLAAAAVVPAVLAAPACREVCQETGHSPVYTSCDAVRECPSGQVCYQAEFQVICVNRPVVLEARANKHKSTTTKAKSTKAKSTKTKSTKTKSTKTKKTKTTTTTTTTTTTATTKPATSKATSKATTTVATTSKPAPSPSATVSPPSPSGPYKPIDLSSRMGKLVIGYWGANGSYGEKNLHDTCAEGSYDVIVVSFLDVYGHNAPLQVHIDHPFAETASGIKYCQSQGIAVLLSAGGANGGQSSLGSAGEATDFANRLWNTFLNGNVNDPTRPFGDAVFNGFDLDVENNLPNNYDAFAKAYRALAPKGQFYLTAAPQCFYPDASMHIAIDNAGGEFDWISPQFYQNYCAAEYYKAGDITNIDARFNYAQWDQVAQQKGFKIAMGLPASTVAGSGYLAPNQVAQVVSEIKGNSAVSSRFAGVMFWSTAHADNNNNFGGAIRKVLG
ncbi:glycoside hydrolase superfamily [Polychytrium aggregatum]|uniref:glycoside hydrolase superfamily n=1 Tax=Polychytrium aggregatum TaxID=110093 RepID=UPI0022FE1296|nr:glycoside hydrolase superfamily [Polychytrium aggregatum]KAI9202678.1 glycoside hydrolase superfamily [Polychytrium aggregatum]